MQQTFVLASLALISFSSASPLVEVRATPGKLHDLCTNVQLNSQGWLIGDCSTGSGNTKITSGVYIYNKITNDNGNLKWSTAGSYQLSCVDCKLTDSSLTCTCRPSGGNDKVSTLSLDDHIGVYSGHILQDLTGAVQVPSGSSKYPFPADTTWGVGGNATCAGPEGSPSWCNSLAHTCSDQASTDMSQTTLTQVFPMTGCWTPQVYLPGKLAFNLFKAAAKEAAWEVTGYADQNCQEKIITISPEQLGKCNTIGSGKLVKGIKSRPLFNGDPN